MSSALRSRSPQPSWQRAAPYSSIGCRRRRAAITQDDHVTRRPRSAVALPCRTGGGPRRQAALSAAAGASRSRETSTPRVVRAQQSLSPDSDALAKGRATRTLRPRPPTGIGPARAGPAERRPHPVPRAPPLPAGRKPPQPPTAAAAGTGSGRSRAVRAYAHALRPRRTGRPTRPLVPPPPHPRTALRCGGRARGPTRVRGAASRFFPACGPVAPGAGPCAAAAATSSLHTFATRALFGAGLFPPMPPGEPPSLLSLWPSAQAYALQPAKSTS